MRIFYDIFISLAVILNYIGLSAQFECLPNGEPLPGFSRSSTSCSSDEPIPLGRSFTPVRSVAPAEPAFRLRSRSPLRRRRPSLILGHDPAELSFIRIISNKNAHRIFEVRRFTFPADTAIKYRTGRGAPVSLPTSEQLVLTTPNGDIMATFDCNNTFLRAIFTNNIFLRRVKMNMYSGMIHVLRRDEIEEVPAGNNRPISKNFKVLHLNHISRK
ncbi:uncharacterized protein LOC117175955 isoform X2 [Belonocnema kinseyi]|uniref:uncharacterized protein LOC117175955 isoform X2 n=1 Tax=Belonocnema kinseyi TaxID=2817044 RepID=UPI00143D0D5B|nr:uncharacterized protein LOC117175955 isoform X2 [Belonocnema kinseyi]